jgi:hypothetical protein
VRNCYGLSKDLVTPCEGAIAPVAKTRFADASEAHVVGGLVVQQLLLRIGKRDVVVAKINKSRAAAVRQGVVGGWGVPGHTIT